MNIFDNISLERLIAIEGKSTGCLGYMGIGMLGIMMIVAIIMGATYLTNNIINKLDSKSDEE